jgi:hypothetical protein
MKSAIAFEALTRWLRLHATPLLRRLGANARRSLSEREVVVPGACVLLLLVLVAFDVQSIIATASVLAMLWALDQEQRRGRERAALLLDADGKAAGEGLQRRLSCADNARNDEEVPWKLGS